MTGFKTTKETVTGDFVNGVGIQFGDGENSIIMMAPSKEALRKAWKAISGQPLNEAGVYAMAMHQLKPKSQGSALLQNLIKKSENPDAT